MESDAIVFFDQPLPPVKLSLHERSMSIPFHGLPKYVSRCCVVVSGLLLFQLTASRLMAESPKILRSLKEAHDLLWQDDTTDYAVELTASVSFWDRSWRTLFVQDGDTAVFVELSDREYSRMRDLSLGDRLHLEGTFNPQRYVLQVHHFRSLGPGPVPSVKPLNLAEIAWGDHWSRRVRVSGILEATCTGVGRVQLVVRSGAQRFLVRGWANPTTSLPPIAAEIEVTGVLSYLVDDADEPVTMVMHQMPSDEIRIVSEVAASEVATAHDDLAQGASDSYANVDDYSEVPSHSSYAGPSVDAGAGYVLHGRISHVHELEWVLLENDQGESIRVYAPFAATLHAGDIVQVEGRLPPDVAPDLEARRPLLPGRDRLGYGTNLVAERVIVSTTEPLPEAPRLDLSEIYRNRPGHTRASIEGRLQSIKSTSDGREIRIGPPDQTLVCKIRDAAFDGAEIDFGMAESILATGLLIPPAVEGAPYQLEVASVSDLHVTRQLPSVDRRIVLGGLGFFVCVTALIGGFLRLQIRGKERALSRLASRLEGSYQAISEGFLMVDMKGEILGFNPRLFELLDLERSELEKPGQSLSAVGAIIASGIQGNSFARFWDRANSLPGLVEQRMFQTKGASPRSLVVNSTCVHDVSGATDARIWTFGDETRQKRLEANLLQAQKMEAVGRLVGGVSHDFNNSLFTMRMNIDLLRMQPELRICDMAEVVESVDNALERATDLAHSLLGFSRRNQPRFSRSSVNEVVRQTFVLLERSIGMNNDLHLDIAPDVADCMIDQNQMVQVLLNMCINSRDAMEPLGGTITLATANVPENEFGPHANSHLTTDLQRDLRAALMQVDSVTAEESSSRYVRIRITDNGPGIPENTRPLIFDPFFTTKPPGKGTGLGLATSRGIVLQHGGDIVYRSDVGNGACFDIFLPCLTEAQVRRIPPVEDSPEDRPEVDTNAMELQVTLESLDRV